ncbi:hypothetical protein HZA98_00080 [Candidatus Woesearchaeota archaeon]|nr:hypothetical protein [Candidatus Woesearchaeota archaeon]
MDAPQATVAMKRQTAYKIWIHDIHSASMLVDAGTGLPFYSIRDLHVVRVNILGIVIDRFVSEAYGSLVLDDGSGQVRLKVWGDDISLIQDVDVGNLVLVIGRLADFEKERYVRPEIVRGVHYDWALLRRLELVQQFGTPSREEKVVVSEKRVAEKEVEPSLAAREIILQTIEKHEEVDEAMFLSACHMPQEKVQNALYDLLKEGEVFSPKKGFYRLV